MNRSFKWTVWLLLALAAGCVHPMDETPDPGVTTSLSLSFKNIASGSPETKMISSVTQSTGTFRGIETTFVIPFSTNNADPVTAGLRSLENPFGISYPGITELNANNNSYLYTMAMVPSYTNRVLVYGRAVDIRGGSSQALKQRNGVLTASGLDVSTRSDDITFNLECVMTSGTLSEMNDHITAILRTLNDVVTAIRAYNMPVLSNIIDIISRPNQILACSYQTFSTIENEIFTELINISSTMTDAAVAEAVAAIAAKVNLFEAAIEAAGSGFPSSYGIPEGAVGFWWNGQRFVRLINGVNIALVDPATYCYPPCLWYYVNSAVRTSNSDKTSSQYKAMDSWSSILALYNDGGTVFSATRSAAVSDQLQYGVGMMDLSFKAQDNNADIAPALGCPLTGVIVGEQKNADFSFSPLSTSPSRFVYDNAIVTDDQHPNTLSISTPVEVETLLLPSAPDQKVYFALEFENTTNNTLSCQQGDILPRCKFYLVGELVVSAGTQPTGEALTSVIAQDRKTVVNAVAVSLSKAYNTVPDLREPQLEIGILAEMEWKQLTPGEVKMDL